MYANQGEIGRHLGGSSHDVGQWLEEAGLKRGKYPTERAMKDGYVFCASLTSGFRWHLEKTLAALEALGHKRLPQPSEAKPTGPFSTVRGDENEWLVLNGDGTYSVVVIGEENARKLTGVLNYLHINGMYAGIPQPAKQAEG